MKDKNITLARWGIKDYNLFFWLLYVLFPFLMVLRTGFEVYFLAASLLIYLVYAVIRWQVLRFYGENFPKRLDIFLQNVLLFLLGFLLLESYAAFLSENRDFDDLMILGLLGYVPTLFTNIQMRKRKPISVMMNGKECNLYLDEKSKDDMTLTFGKATADMKAQVLKAVMGAVQGFEKKAYFMAVSGLKPTLDTLCKGFKSPTVICLEEYRKNIFEKKVLPRIFVLTAHEEDLDLVLSYIDGIEWGNIGILDTTQGNEVIGEDITVEHLESYAGDKAVLDLYVSRHGQSADIVNSNGKGHLKAVAEVILLSFK